MLDTDNAGKYVSAKKAYSNCPGKEMQNALGFKDEIQRKAKLGKLLSEYQQRRNQRIATKHARSNMSSQEFGIWELSSPVQLDSPEQLPR